MCDQVTARDALRHAPFKNDIDTGLAIKLVVHVTAQRPPHIEHTSQGRRQSPADTLAAMSSTSISATNSIAVNLMSNAITKKGTLTSDIVPTSDQSG